jgi:hypothetical protein
LNFQEGKPSYDFTTYWQDEPIYENNLTKIAGPRSSIKSPCLKNNQIVKITSAKGYRNLINSASRKTLIDYNGPAIMEDLNGKNDQDFTNHIRVKRNEPANDSIVHRWNRSADSFDSLLRNSCDTNNVTNASDSVSKLGVSYVDLNRRSLPDVFYEAIADTSHPRYKRRVLIKNGEHRKRMKGNAGHSRHHIKGTKVKSKMRGSSKSLHRRHPRLLPSFSPVESENNTSNININADEKIEINQKNNALLINNRTWDEQQGSNPIALPLVHTGRMEFRVRIEKVPTNESSFVNPNNSTENIDEKTSYLLTPKDKMITKIFDNDLTSSKLVSNWDFEGKGMDNLTMKNMLKKVKCKNHDCDQKTNNFVSTMLRDADSLSVDSSLRGIKDNQSLENAKTGNRAKKASAESIDEDMKSRAKRNQEISSKNRRSSVINVIDCDSKDAAQKSTRDTKHKKRKNRRKPAAVRSIDDIKDLAERLIIKVKD